MPALDDDKSKRLCSLIEKNILKDGYFILDVDDWDGLHIDYKPVLHGKNYEYADYTEITVSLDRYKASDKVQVKYNFIRSVYVGRTGDNYRVYYKREDGERDGGTPYSVDDAAKFIANRFIELVDDKIMNNKLEARIARLEKLLSNKSTKNEVFNMTRKLTLEQRIARLERAIKNSTRTVNESFETDADVEGARAAADRMANQFSQMTGAKLSADVNYRDIIDSPMYGQSSNLEDLEDDPDARFTFSYNVEGYPADQVMIRPTDRTVCVWRSIYDGYEGEGAVDPKTGYCEWYNDGLDECSYPMSAWKDFSFDMIHGDDYEESLRRRRTRRCESRRSSRR